jgi:phage portal protein BeeE
MPIEGGRRSHERRHGDAARDLYACVNRISQDIAKVPLAHVSAEGRRRPRARARSSGGAAAAKPTPQFTGMEWRERLQAHQLLRGNAYCVIKLGLSRRGA